MVTIEPFVFDLFAFKLSFRFLLRAIWIGTRELTKGIKSPSKIARIVALADGMKLRLTPDWPLNIKPYKYFKEGMEAAYPKTMLGRTNSTD
jgi:hypothetical protein